ncbi:hypothetical protein QYM36_016265 [Artemia franciscana]|uniref:Uncharacterized protein n=1 Tax=Artemia franciscana TaxID=6661 RepID=A0AA88KXX2_ARTSF|nr:hypothetical protein QYM36_016265 [Artemia franciscana]
MNGPSLRPSGKPENPTVQPVLPPQNGAAMPPRTLHPPPGLYPIAQMQEMYNAASQYQYAPPVAHIHNAAHLAAMAPPPAHLLGTHTGMAPIQAMHAMTVPQTHFTQNVSAPAAETIKPPSTKTAQSLVASSPPKDETTNNVSSAASKPVESVNEPDIKSQNSNEEVSSFEKPSDLVPVKSDENGVREDKDKVETSVSEVSSTESETKEENKPTEESVEAETDEKPSENVVATKSIPESTDVTSTPDTTKELEAPQQEKEDVKEEKEVKESPKEEPKEEIGTVVRPPSPKKTPTKTKAEKKSEVIKPLVIQKKIEKPAKEPKPEVEKASPPKRKRDESAKRATPPKPDSGSGDDRKSKRARTQTQPFQAALEDLTYLRMVKKLSQPPKATEEKVTIFLKNEFLAVRNPEGSFYVCRTLQDVLRNSHNIKICWMTNDKQPSKDIYVKDYNDKTDFECILTNLTMEKVDKDSFRLPEEEAKRTENILKRALDREKGVVDASITEDNPDGSKLSTLILCQSRGEG